MKSISITSLLLSLALLVSLAVAIPATAPAASPTTAPINVIAKACQNSTKKALCVSVFNSDPNSKNADLKDLAFIALKITGNKAAETSKHIKSMLNKESSDDLGELEDCLNECAQSYVDVVDQINDSMDALVNKKFKNVNSWVKAAIADVAFCNGNVKKQSSAVAKEIVGKNTYIHDLCRNALEVVRVLHHSVY